MNHHIINELFAASRANRFRYDEYKDDESMTAGCWAVAFCAVAVTSAWAVLLGALVRWAWNHWEEVLRWVGL